MILHMFNRTFSSKWKSFLDKISEEMAQIIKDALRVNGEKWSWGDRGKEILERYKKTLPKPRNTDRHKPGYMREYMRKYRAKLKATQEPSKTNAEIKER